MLRKHLIVKRCCDYVNTRQRYLFRNLVIVPKVYLPHDHEDTQKIWESDCFFTIKVLIYSTIIKIRVISSHRGHYLVIIIEQGI